MSTPPEVTAPAAAEPVRELPPLPSEFRAVGLVRVEAVDVELETADAIETELLSQIDLRTGFRGAPSADVSREASDAGAAPEACGREVACLARAGRYARTHVVIEYRLASLGGALSVSLRSIDTERAVEMARVAEQLGDGPEERAEQLRLFVVRLLEPASYVGTLSFVVSQVGAEIYLDERFLGASPLAQPVSGIAAGPHVLRVSAPGFADLHRFVDVVFERTVTLEIDMENTTVGAALDEVAPPPTFGALFIATDVTGVEVLLDGAAVGALSAGTPLANIPVGGHRLVARVGAEELVVENVSVVADRRTDLRIRRSPTGVLEAEVLGTVEVLAALPLIERAAPPVTPPPAVVAERSWRWPVAIGSAAIGGVALLAAGYAGVQVERANEDARKLESSFAGSLGSWSRAAEFRQRAQEIDRQGERAQSAEYLLLGTGLGLVCTGGALLLYELFFSNAGE